MAGGLFTATPLLTRRTILLAQGEERYGELGTGTVGTDDGILCSDPTYMADPTLLERDYTRDSLSPLSHIVGRMEAKMEFTTELRGNGTQNSGVAGDEPRIARLFAACGYSCDALVAPGVIGDFDINEPLDVRWRASGLFRKGSFGPPEVSWTFATGSLDADEITHPILITVRVASGGGSTVEIFSHPRLKGQTSDAFPAAGSNSHPLTSGTAITVPFPNDAAGTARTSSFMLTPTFSGSTLPAGGEWFFWIVPKGFLLRPLSGREPSVRLEMNRDGVKHTMPGSYGTFEITANAGEYASVKWTFMGLYQDPEDESLVTPSYERTLPAQMESANLIVDPDSTYDGQFVCEKFTYNQNNDIQIRPDINSYQGYRGVRIVSRKPEGGIDPEAVQIGDYNFWDKLRLADRFPMHLRVGNAPGNQVWIMAPSVQYTNATYQDRQGILTYDAGLKFAGHKANDEILFYFC